MSFRNTVKSLFDKAVSWSARSPTPALAQQAVESDDGADMAARLLGEKTRRQDGTASLQVLIAHNEQFASRWGGGVGVYWSRFDEALRDNWINALAMRRSSFIEELMSSRKYPVTGMDWHIESDNAKDEGQKKIVDRVTQCMNAIPYFTAMRYYLGEDKWQGKYGSQLQWSQVTIDDQPMVGITAHEPVDGDSIVYNYDKIPGVLVRSGWKPPRPSDQDFLFQPKSEWFQSTDRATALFLKDQYWRDHFVISNFNPRSADYLYEGDKAAAIFGLGYRGMLYWDFQLREELRSWLIDALQRIGVNGMLYGFFESGNAPMMHEVVLALKMLIRDNVTAFPFLKGQQPSRIEHIEPSSVGYDVLSHWIDNLEQTMRRCVLGQSLSSMVGATGMGSEVAKLHEQTIQHVIRSDAQAQQEVITRDILGPMIRFNTWEYNGQKLKGKLPFGLRFVYNFEKADAVERAGIINSAYQMGLPLSIEQIQQDIGISPPKSQEDTIQSPQFLAAMLQLQQGMMMPSGQPGQMPVSSQESEEAPGATPEGAPSGDTGTTGGVPASSPSYVPGLVLGAVSRGTRPGLRHAISVKRGPDGKLILSKRVTRIDSDQGDLF